MRTDIYQGYNVREASEAYYQAWFDSTSFRDIPDVVYEMGQFAFALGFDKYHYLFDRDFYPEAHEWFGFIDAAHRAGIRARDEWTEGN